MQVVLQNWKRETEEIRLSDSTIELSLPEGITFAGYDSLPTHMHHLTSDGGRTYRSVAMFVRRGQCPRCERESR